MGGVRPLLHRDFSRVEPHAVAARVAILVPCYNEAPTIGAVVKGFQAALPQAKIYVYDNNSHDETVPLALEAGAIVREERRQGKGQVIRRMFSDIDADCYILVDGDHTYDPSVAAQVAELIAGQGRDFVNVLRVATGAGGYRRGHKLGNLVLTQIVRVFFGPQIDDVLSGFKGFSRRFVKSFPAMSNGFETETELTVHALEMRMPLAEIEGAYRERPVGSISKLRTYRDGIRILMLIFRLIKDERPLQFFSTIGLILGVSGISLSIPIILNFFSTGLVPRFPTAILSVGLVLLSWLCIFTGIILDVVSNARREVKRLAYLSIPPFGVN